MSDDKLWEYHYEQNPEKPFKYSKKLQEAERQLGLLPGWCCPPPVEELLNLLVSYLKEQEKRLG